jgi:protein SHQ1
MITPPFRCWQDDRFVFIEIRIGASLVVKLSTAEFAIADNKFVFHCRPLYLRLSFVEMLTEGAGEKATYNVDDGLLVVQLAKRNEGEPFSRLDDPQFLLLTDVQRKQHQASARKLVEVVAEQHEDEDDEEELDCEFVQQLASASSELLSVGCQLASATDSSAQRASYGFAGRFSGVFAGLDRDVVRDILQLDVDPEAAPKALRRSRRMQREEADFDEEAMLCSLEDADGEVAALLEAASRCPPSYIRTFEAALRSEGVRWLGQGSQVQPFSEVSESGPGMAGHEEEESDEMAGSGVQTVWTGNMMEMTTTAGDMEERSDGAEPPRSETGPALVTAPVQELPSEGPEDQEPCHPAERARNRLASPSTKPRMILTMEESATLQSLSPNPNPGPSSPEEGILLIELLCAVMYEKIATAEAGGGDSEGSSESLWTVTMLSPSLSWLDTPLSVYDACVTFTRRVLTYPLHRHVDLVHRTWRDVGVLLLLGRPFVVRQLLWLRRLLGHSDSGKHVLNRLFVDPLLGSLMNSYADCDAANKALERLAVVLHNIATMTEPVRVVLKKTQTLSRGLLQRTDEVDSDEAAVVMVPITVLSVGLPTGEQARLV